MCPKAPAGAAVRTAPGTCSCSTPNGRPRNTREPADFTRLAAFYSCLRCWPLHRGLRGFFRTGKNYTQFPDRQTFRVYLEDLRNEESANRLRKIWLDPASLDPAQARRKSRATSPNARAGVAGSGNEELSGGGRRHVSDALFVHDVCCKRNGLLPEKSLQGDFWRNVEKKPEIFTHDVAELWEAMNDGELGARIQAGRYRNSTANLFAERESAAARARRNRRTMRQAASYNWKEVDPAIFGTLLEQALDPEERKRLGRTLHATRVCRTTGGRDHHRTVAGGLAQRAGDG